MPYILTILFQFLRKSDESTIRGDSLLFTLQFQYIEGLLHCKINRFCAEPSKIVSYISKIFQMSSNVEIN